MEIPVTNVKPGTVAVLVHPDGTEEIIKNSVPTEDGIQLTVNGGATVKIVDNSKDFIDTREHWSRDQVNFVAARELFQGVGDNQFGVGRPMTRGMVNTVLARLAGVDTTPLPGRTGMIRASRGRGKTACPMERTPTAASPVNSLPPCSIAMPGLPP